MQLIFSTEAKLECVHEGDKALQEMIGLTSLVQVGDKTYLRGFGHPFPCLGTGLTRMLYCGGDAYFQTVKGSRVIHLVPFEDD